MVSKKTKSLLEQKLREHFQRLATVDARSRAALYEIEKYNFIEMFMDGDFYWQDCVRTARFSATFRKGCLYRPQVVNDLYSKVELAVNCKVRNGIFIKGPHGIGKSHLLVNLVRKLLYGSDGKYLVTFIPDCSFFETDGDLLNAICYSFGTTPEELAIPHTMFQTDFEKFIAAIDSILKDMDKQWILIYDQINKIFDRLEFMEVKDLGTMSFPFNLILKAIKPGRITSIISASPNIEIAYKDRHEGFEEFFHPLSMEWNELQMLYPSLADKDEDLIMKLTGGVPLQVSNLINVNFDVGIYMEMRCGVQFFIQ